MPGRKKWKWGILFSGDKLTMEDLLRYAKMAADAGAESLWSAELWRDAFVPATAMAAVAPGVRVGTAVCHFARPPMLTEMAAMSLAEYTGARFVLGLGTSTPYWNENWHGIEFRRPVERMREYVECIRAMWTSSPTRPVSYQGEFFNVKEYRRLMPPPYEHVPIYLAAVMPRMIRLAGSHGDGVILNALNAPQYFTQIVHPNLKKSFQASGRTPNGFEICSLKICSVNENAKEARALARHAVAFYTTPPYFDIVLDPLGFTQPKMRIRAAMDRNDIPGMLDAVTEEMIEALTLAGTPDEVRRKLDAFDGLFETPLLFSPSFAADPEEVKANHEAIIETFAD